MEWVAAAAVELQVMIAVHSSLGEMKSQKGRADSPRQVYYDRGAYFLERDCIGSAPGEWLGP